MIISLRVKNFYSLRDEVVLDFTADRESKKSAESLPENLLTFSGDEFVNIIGLFGSNAAGKSNLIKAVDACRRLVLESRHYTENSDLGFEQFKFSHGRPSEFYIDFVADGLEYEYSFSILDDRIESESLYYYPNKRRAKVFERRDGDIYTFGKGILSRPKALAAEAGSKNLFLSIAGISRPIAQIVYRFFLEQLVVGLDDFDLSQLTPDKLESNKKVLLMALETGDSDIVDIAMVETAPGRFNLKSYHKENPAVEFDFEREESDGTKRLFKIMLMMLKKTTSGATVFLDEFDLKLHLRLAELLLDTVRASRGGQLVFTSHNPWLINPASLRREQIVFVTKQPDGNSEFVALSEYQGVKKDTDIRKAYLQGRFDGVPYTGNIYPVFQELLKK